MDGTGLTNLFHLVTTFRDKMGPVGARQETRPVSSRRMCTCTGLNDNVAGTIESYQNTKLLSAIIFCNFLDRYFFIAMILFIKVTTSSDDSGLFAFASGKRCISYITINLSILLDVCDPTDFACSLARLFALQTAAGWLWSPFEFNVSCQC